MSRKWSSRYESPRRRVSFDTILKIEEAFDRDALQRICEMSEEEFAERYDMTVVKVPQVGADFYAFRDNGSDVLAVAHLDTVARHAARACNFVETEAGTVVYSRALDDRLGAYIILDLLPKLGLEFDILLTVGEETGQSTAAYFETIKQYHWMIEFDRGGTDVVMYQYDDDATRELVKDCGAVVGDGIFSDISVLDHLECKGFNWGVGYEDYHSARSHAFLEDTFEMVERFLYFHAMNAETYLPHDERPMVLGKRPDDDEDSDFAESYDPDDPDQMAYEEWWRETHSVPLSEDLPEVMRALWQES